MKMKLNLSAQKESKPEFPKFRCFVSLHWFFFEVIKCKQTNVKWKSVDRLFYGEIYSTENIDKLKSIIE